ncbi:VUT family protein [Thiotrichales bacterium 19S11-10]|nr:VUT family protein [Thiotrichales bacterium 19S11-10]
MFKKEVSILSIFILMAYMGVKITCNILFFDHIEFNFFGISLRMTGSAVLYPLVFVLLDWMVLVFGIRWAMLFLLFGLIVDGVSSSIITLSSTIEIPQNLSPKELVYTQSVHNLSPGFYPLFWHGLLGSIVAYLAELLLFNALYKRTFKENFWLSTVASIATTMAIHNLINDYNMFAGYDDRWHLIISNYSVNMLFVITYTTVVTLIRKLGNQFKFNRVVSG